jgi:hypothetical protein
MCAGRKSSRLSLVLSAFSFEGHARTLVQISTRVARFGALHHKIDKTQGLMDFGAKWLMMFLVVGVQNKMLMLSSKY